MILVIQIKYSDGYSILYTKKSIFVCLYVFLA